MQAIKRVVLCHTCIFWMLLVGESLRADVLELKNGGKIEGTLEDSGKDARSSYTIVTEGGARLTISRSRVKRVIRTSPTDEEYNELAQKGADTVAAHWQLAEWCRNRKQRDASRHHLERILEIDPEHAKARLRLGYQKVGSVWMTRDELMAARGLVLYSGKYRTRQHIELLDRSKQKRQSEIDWSDRLAKLYRRLKGRRLEQAQQARDEILAIRDPQAAKALVQMIHREEREDVKQMLIEAAAQIDHTDTFGMLVDLSLHDPNEEIRYQCLEYLIQSGHAGIVTPYIRTLKNTDNRMVNRAASALQTIGDPSALSPLIDALVTRHKYQAGRGSGGEHAYSFSPDGGGGGFSFGGGGPQTVTQSQRNPDVLSALVMLSGGISFGFDQEQWRHWLAGQAKLKQVGVRRDL